MTEFIHYSVDKQIVFIMGNIYDIIQYCEEHNTSYSIFASIDSIISYEERNKRDVNILHVTSQNTNYYVSFRNTETPWGWLENKGKPLFFCCSLDAECIKGI